VLIYERDARQRQLNTIYTPAEPRRLMPSQISEEIVLVHPAQPFPSSLPDIKENLVTGAADVTTIFGSTPQADRYFWVHAAAVLHTDPTNRDMNLALENIISGITFRLVVTFQQPGNRPVLLARSIIVPPGYRIHGFVGALSPGENLDLRVLFLDLGQAELPPWL